MGDRRIFPTRDSVTPEEAEAGYEVLRSQLAGVVSDKSAKATNNRILLRDAVCAYIIARQDKGASDATIVRAVTRALRDAEEDPGSLAHHLVDWCSRRQRNLS
jgi:hypothetical protein